MMMRHPCVPRLLISSILLQSTSLPRHLRYDTFHRTKDQIQRLRYASTSHVCRRPAFNHLWVLKGANLVVLVVVRRPIRPGIASPNNLVTLCIGLQKAPIYLAPPRARRLVALDAILHSLQSTLRHLIRHQIIPHHRCHECDSWISWTKPLYLLPPSNY
jgi:hypothetical protein